jgi:hypothetical protein
MTVRSKAGLLSSRNCHAALSESVFEALYPKTTFFESIAEAAVTWRAGERIANSLRRLQIYWVPVFFSVISPSDTQILERVQDRHRTAKQHKPLYLWSAHFMCALQKTGGTISYVSTIACIMEVCDIPLNSWVDEVFLKVGDTEIDW